ncbi:uncharacterized protein LOC131594533 [Vicia villosa]|uniref:uncharacterized protein LOC131594533 n=1 Tax=Vicia villosa TaxID=3911 RepID=UPI00273AE715|nr:uncharacterized protein LOC131594533 [Vicia villosa]
MDLDEWESISDDGYFEMEYLHPSPPRKQNQLVPLQIPLDLKIGNTSKDVVLLKDMPKHQSFEEDQEENVSQVFFKIKENEFVDMKIESPKSSSSKEMVTSPRMIIEKDVFGEKEDSSWEEENNSGFSLWKWSLSGVGAICTFGVVVASICVVYFGSQQRKKLQQDKKIMFQIYADDKRIKQVVQHATKLNEAISAVRGVPITRAHITVGGNYDLFD